VPSIAPVPVAAMKDLCLDAADPSRAARWWGGVLGLDVEVFGDGDAVLRERGRAVFWVNGVPEPKTVKNRVHVDLRAADTPGDLVSRQDGFTVRADPEGNEFCVFPGPGAPELAAVCTDSPDPAAIAAWWAPLLGARVEPGPDGVPRYLAGGAGFAEGVLWKFVPVDDPRTVKNRWHWDVHAEPADLVAAGAVVLRERDDAIRWTVLADPDGNEFCAFAPSA
jgi:catechol 2,3-dioxygenase-like lactoylglutathione lyase family enzyme